MALISVPDDIIEKVCELKCLSEDGVEDIYEAAIHEAIEHFHFHCNPCNDDLDSDEVFVTEDHIACPSCGTSVEMYV